MALSMLANNCYTKAQIDELLAAVTSSVAAATQSVAALGGDLSASAARNLATRPA